MTFPPWQAMYQPTQRWLQAACFEAMVNDLRSVLRVAQGRLGQPSAIVMEARTLQSTCESGAPRWLATDTSANAAAKSRWRLTHWAICLAVQVTPANESERVQVQALAQEVQQVTGQTVNVALVDQGYTGESAAQAARQRRH